MTKTEIRRRLVERQHIEETPALRFEHCTYSDGFCHDFEAVQVRWADLKAAGFAGDGSDSDEIVAALLAAGAPAWVQDAGGWVDETWVQDASGWVDEIGWGLIGPQIQEEATT